MMSRMSKVHTHLHPVLIWPQKAVLSEHDVSFSCSVMSSDSDNFHKCVAKNMIQTESCSLDGENTPEFCGQSRFHVLRQTCMVYCFAGMPGAHVRCILLRPSATKSGRSYVVMYMLSWRIPPPPLADPPLG